MVKLLVYDVSLLTPQFEMPLDDEAGEVLKAFDTNKDGKVDIKDFLEYMIGSLTRSKRMREHYKSLSKFNLRMDNLVDGLFVALDNDPVEEMHTRMHELLGKYSKGSDGKMYVQGFLRLFADMKEYAHSNDPALETEEEAKRLMEMLIHDDPAKGVEEDIVVSWVSEGLTKPPEVREKLKENSIFHAKTILFIETILAYLKTHPSHASGDGKEIAISSIVKKWEFLSMRNKTVMGHCF